ncbi:MAG: hypothetical protein Kow0047_32170 [Anaerolineae bacterium]
MKAIRALLIAVLLVTGLGSVPTRAAATTAPAGWIAFAARQEHTWSLFAIDASSGELRRLPIDAEEVRDPAWSPDGRSLGYVARRDRQWDLHVLDLARQEDRALTADRPYDGAPAWSPDGRWIAYESMASGDLDVWLLPAEGGEPRNLTIDSPSGDFGPQWAPAGPFAGWLAFTSWRLGDKDVFLLHPDTGEIQQLTTEPVDEELAAWSPDGRSIYFFRDEDDRREVWALDVTTANARPRRVTWLTRVIAATPAGGGLAVIYRRADGEGLLWLPPEDGGLALPEELVWRAPLSGRISYHPSPIVLGERIAGGAQALDDAPQPDDGVGVARFVEVPGVSAAGPASLSSRVADSFLALKARVLEETGYDFLAEVSEMWRSPGFYSDSSDYLSWHKTGRAVDLALDFYDEERHRVLERVREDMGGETFWRLYLRCRAQDGSCGRPLTDRTWDLTAEARSGAGWGRGGLPGLLYGQYFVDFTELAREYGWRRIGSYEEEDFDWRTNFKALEYWHYERRDGQQWYPLMLQVLSPSEAETHFTWDDAMAHGVDPFYAFMKGVPLPREEWRWRLLRP